MDAKMHSADDVPMRRIFPNKLGKSLLLFALGLVSTHASTLRRFRQNFYFDFHVLDIITAFLFSDFAFCPAFDTDALEQGLDMCVDPVARVLHLLMADGVSSFSLDGRKCVNTFALQPGKNAGRVAGGMALKQPSIIFVATNNLPMVQVIRADGTHLGCVGQKHLLQPNSVAYDAKTDTIFVSDRSPNRVLHFASNGDCLGNLNMGETVYQLRMSASPAQLLVRTEYHISGFNPVNRERVSRNVIVPINLTEFNVHPERSQLVGISKNYFVAWKSDATRLFLCDAPTPASGYFHTFAKHVTHSIDAVCFGLDENTLYAYDADTNRIHRLVDKFCVR